MCVSMQVNLSPSQKKTWKKMNGRPGRNEQRKKWYKVLVIVQAEWQVFTILFCFLCICLKLSIIQSFILFFKCFKERAYQVIFVDSSFPEASQFVVSWGKAGLSGYWSWSQLPWPQSLWACLFPRCVWWPWILNFGPLTPSPAIISVLLSPVLLLSLWSGNRPSLSMGLWPSHSTHV